MDWHSVPGSDVIVHMEIVLTWIDSLC